MAKTGAERNAPAEIKAMNFEDALRELEAIVERLEGGQGDLEDAIAAYERGVALKTHCEAKLKDAELKVEKISRSLGGAAKAEAVDIK